MEMRLKEKKGGGRGRRGKLKKKKKSPLENNACKEEKEAGTLCELIVRAPQGGHSADRAVGVWALTAALCRASLSSADQIHPNSPTANSNKHSYAARRAGLCLEAEQLHGWCRLPDWRALLDLTLLCLELLTWAGSLVAGGTLRLVQPLALRAELAQQGSRLSLHPGSLCTQLAADQAVTATLYKC